MRYHPAFTNRQMADYTNIPRDSRRVPLETRVQFKFDRFSGFISEYSSNISPGGIFIKTQSPLPVGQALDFAFRLGDGFELIKGRGEVMWSRAVDEGPLRPAGMGLRFLELSEGSRELIYRIVDQHIQEGGTPFDVSLVPPDPIPLPPPSPSLLEPSFGEPFMPATPPLPSAGREPDSDLDASAWLPALDDAGVGPPPLPGILGMEDTSAAPAPEPPPIFGSASREQPRRILPLALMAAVLLLVLAGVLFKDRLLELAGGGGGGREAAQAPSPEARSAPAAPAPRPAPPAGAPAVQETGAAPNPETAPAPAPAPPERAKPTGPPLTAVKDITWEEAFGGTDVIVWGNGAVRSEVYERTRIEGNPPRELVRLKGIERSFPKTRVVVGTSEVLQVRVGYHLKPGGNELHIVLDLAHPGVVVTRVEEGEDQLRIHLQRR